MTVASDTSPRAIRAARRGGAAPPRVQQQEGRVDVRATGEAGVEAVGAEEGGTGSAEAAAAVGLGAVPPARAAAAAALELAESGPAAPAVAGIAGGVPAALPDDASDDVSAPHPAATPQIQSTPAVRGPAAEREGTVAPGELAAVAAEAGAAGPGLAAVSAAVPEVVLPLEETGVAAAAEATELAEGAPPAEMEGAAFAAAAAAATSVDGLISPSGAGRAALPLREDGGPAAEELQTAPGWADSPAPLGTAEIAAVVAGAARRQRGSPSEETAPTVAESAGTSVAAAAANTQGHGQAGGDRPGPGAGAVAGASHGKTGRKLRV
ncbi:unnamed protein product [Closterium sp. Yama58-4]|nr:unnamed protein product [Closterium sp. Yama58-4]